MCRRTISDLPYPHPQTQTRHVTARPRGSESYERGAPNERRELVDLIACRTRELVLVIHVLRALSGHERPATHV
jgi:hypothetical protein